MNDDLQAILESLRRNYLKTLPEKIQAIETLFKEQNADQVKREFHKLKGTGKTYGLPEVSELCLLAEQLSEVPDSTYEEAVPLALGLLWKIHETRSGGNEFDLNSSDTFRQLHALPKSQAG